MNGGDGLTDLTGKMTEIHANTERIRAEQERKALEQDAAGPKHVPEFSGYADFVERVEAYSARDINDPTGPTTITEPTALPVDAQARKDIPLVTGLLDYFPAALAEVAKVSKAGNDKHNPGEPLHWARGKSMDQADCIGRHLLERGGFDPETGQRHSAQMAWRALALLQLEMEAAGAPMARGAA